MARMIQIFVAGTFLAFSSASFAQAPPPAQNLTARVLQGPAATGATTMVSLTWQPPMGSMGMRYAYSIGRSIGDTSHFETLAMVTMPSYLDRDVMAGETYSYRVFVLARVDTGVVESAPSNTATVTIGPPTPRPHGTISGTITDSVSGAPIRFASVLFYRDGMGWLLTRLALTDTAGRYSAVLDTGTYRLRAQAGFWPMGMPLPFVFPPIALMLYQPEWFDDAETIANATPVVVTDGSKTTADFDLRRLLPPTLATVSGTVMDTTGNPLKNALVTFAHPLSETPLLAWTGMDIPGMGDTDLDLDDIGRLPDLLQRVWTDSLGHYSARLVTGRSYIVMAVKRGFLPQFYNHQADPRNADKLLVTGNTSGIDFALTPRSSVTNNSIAGDVRDSVGMGIPSHIILIPVEHPFAVRFGATDSDGVYMISNVRAGGYFVLAIPFRGYAPAFYKAGAFGITHWQDADTVHISGAVTGISVGVVPVGGNGVTSIAGMVQSEGGAVGGVSVYALDAGGAVVGCDITDNAGAYAMAEIPAGQITMLADREGYSPGQEMIDVGSEQYSVNAVTLSMSPTPLTSVGSSAAAVPLTFALDQNYPNPFNPSTKISFSLPAAVVVRLTVFNLLGQEIAGLSNESMAAGRHDVVWNGKDNGGRAVSSGLYFYRLDATTAGGATFTSTKKMVLLK